MVAILGAYAVLGAGFIGLGTIGYRLIDKTRFSPTWAFWLGWGITIATAQIWHFFMPINDNLRLFLLGIACASLLINHKLLIGALLPISRQKIVWLVITILIGLYSANRATYSTADYTAFGFDTGFYHLPVIEWFNQHPVVIGLANVHTRFGFSNAYFLYGALVNWENFAGKPYLVMNSLLYVVFLSQTAWSIITIVSKQEKQPEHIFRVLCLPFVLMWLFWRSAEGLGVSSTSNDVPIFMLGILLGGRLLGMIEARDTRLIELWTICLLVCVGIAVKFSFVVLGGGLLLVAGLLFIGQKKHIGVALMGSIAIGALILIPMMSRSVIMTGYPLYPLAIGKFDVDWRINPQTALYESEHIQTFGRVLGDTPMYDTLINNPNSEWLIFWLEKSARDYPVFFYTPLILGIVGFLTIILKRKIRPIELSFVGIIAISIAFWFISAPLWRLSGGVTWLFGAGLVAIGLRRFYKPITLLLLIGMCAFVLIDGTNNREFTFDLVTGEQPTPIQWVEPSQTYFGLTVNVSQDWLCWDYALPCVPKQHYSPLLKERAEGGYQLPSYAVLFNPATRQILLVMDTLEAVALDETTSLTATLTPLNADFTPMTNTPPENVFNDYTKEIMPISLENRNNFPTTLQMGIIELPILPDGLYALIGEWNGAQSALADVWQIRNFRFGDNLQITDAILRRDENRVIVQLVGVPLRAIPTRYHVAIWLRGESGEFQMDVSPTIPTHDWGLDGRYDISAQFGNLPRGTYSLSVVWYDVYDANLSRLKGYDADDVPLGEDVVLIKDMDL
ncbi:MAG: hypothetical protein SFZ02_02660 [bacterium]|nr:hypothetical protein [bacterium]